MISSPRCPTISSAGQISKKDAGAVLVAVETMKAEKIRGIAASAR
jgi:hypothetical protein